MKEGKREREREREREMERERERDIHIIPYHKDAKGSQCSFSQKICHVLNGYDYEL